MLGLGRFRLLLAVTSRDAPRGSLTAGKEVSAMGTSTIPKRPTPDGQKYVFRAYITLKNGRRLYARSFGLKAWPIKVSA